MIKNETQYKNTQEWIVKFEHSLAAYDKDEERKNYETIVWQMNRDALQSHFNALKEEITEYERLVNWDKKEPIKITVNSLNQLPTALIKARIAAKITYKELADRLKTDEQKIEQYEETDYQNASFLELLEISEILAIELESANLIVDPIELKNRKKIVDKYTTLKNNTKNDYS